VCALFLFVGRLSKEQLDRLETRVRNIENRIAQMNDNITTLTNHMNEFTKKRVK